MRIHICCIYQYKLLPEIAQLIEDDILDPASIMDFNVWYHRQEPLNQEVHDAMLPEIESAWHGRFAAREHDDMSQIPDYIARDATANMWSDRTVANQHHLRDESSVDLHLSGYISMHRYDHQGSKVNCAFWT